MTTAQAPALARGQHEGVHAAVAVVGADLARQLGVEREARAGQRAQRRAVAPVEREEAAGLAGRGARHARALDHGDGDAAAGQEVGHRGAHDAGAADDDVPRRGSWPVRRQRADNPPRTPSPIANPSEEAPWTTASSCSPPTTRSSRTSWRAPSRSAASSRCGFPSTRTSRPAGAARGRAGGELPEGVLALLRPLRGARWRRRRATKRCGSAPGICLVVERDPITLAKEVATLDHLSGGRVLFGIGGGWNAEEMENHGTASRRAGKLLRERILAMKAIWTERRSRVPRQVRELRPDLVVPKPRAEAAPADPPRRRRRHDASIAWSSTATAGCRSCARTPNPVEKIPALRERLEDGPGAIRSRRRCPSSSRRPGGRRSTPSPRPGCSAPSAACPPRPAMRSYRSSTPTRRRCAPDRSGRRGSCRCARRAGRGRPRP